jgi:hypothetical protein
MPLKQFQICHWHSENCFRCVNGTKIFSPTRILSEKLLKSTVCDPNYCSSTLHKLKAVQTARLCVTSGFPEVMGLCWLSIVLIMSQQNPNYNSGYLMHGCFSCHLSRWPNPWELGWVTEYLYMALCMPYSLVFCKLRLIYQEDDCGRVHPKEVTL